MNQYTMKNIKKLKIYDRKTNSNFRDNKIPKQGAHCIFYQLY